MARRGELQVATAHGPGAGRFLAAALLDALNAGATLVEVVESPRPPSMAVRGVDFVFTTPDDETDEIIRAGLGGDSTVVSAELRRCAKLPRADGQVQSRELVEALRAAQAVAELRWGGVSGRALVVTVRTDLRVQLDLGRPDGDLGTQSVQ
jgi:hypothetical protein